MDDKNIYQIRMTSDFRAPKQASDPIQYQTFKANECVAVMRHL